MASGCRENCEAAAEPRLKQCYELFLIQFTNNKI